MLTILFVHLVGLASPGPDFFYVVRQSASHSTRAGILAATGISLGIIFWASFAIFGLAWLNNYAGNMVQAIIMLIGGSYLAYIGILMMKVRENATFNNGTATVVALNNCQEIRKGLMINIFNAKAGVYFSSVVSAFIGNFNQTYQLWLLLFLFVFTTFLYFLVVAILFSRRPVRQFYSKYSRYIDNIAGVIFFFFGLSLIYEGITNLGGTI